MTRFPLPATKKTRIEAKGFKNALEFCTATSGLVLVGSIMFRCKFDKTYGFLNDFDLPSLVCDMHLSTRDWRVPDRLCLSTFCWIHSCEGGHRHYLVTIQHPCSTLCFALFVATRDLMSQLPFAKWFSGTDNEVNKHLHYWPWL
ncbi:hypothetical protein GGU11DRAFT_304750 [Lentinula aff. detonsa]|nr:hypothetical protein GGU11DRAFT_304750 [Lentinula aff. detonsa]